MPTRPISPYGVTKLASENLCFAHADRGLPLVVLRFFSVYGPRHRPDMGYYKFIDWMLKDQPVIITGDGYQVRGNTYVDDCVAATMAALKLPAGETYNLGGGETASVWDILHKLEKILGKKCKHAPNRRDPATSVRPLPTRENCYAISAGGAETGLDEGLRKQVEWQRAAHPA